MEFIKNRTQLFACLLIVLIGTIIYANSFNGDFQFDDGVHIVRDNSFNDLNAYSKISNWTNINERPLAYFTLALNRSYFGTEVLSYHIFNLLIHLLTSFVVYLFIHLLVSQTALKFKFLDGKEKLFALFVALIFLCHPIQTQAVTYVVQRMTSMAALFYLSSVFFYLKARISYLTKKGLDRSVFFFFLMILTAIASVLSKQIAVTLPLAYLLVEFFFIRNPEGKRFNKFLIFGLVTIGIALLGILLSGLLPKETNDITRYEYFVTQLRVMVKYVQLLVLPISQNLDYDFTISTSIFGLDEIFSALVVSSLVILIFSVYRKSPLISFGIAWFFITLIVESSIIPIRDVIVEHRLYLPMFGFAIAMAALIFSFFKTLKEGQLIGLMAVLLIVYSGLTISRNEVWKTKLSLWQDVVSKSPNKARPHLNLGIAYLHLFKPVQAIKQFEMAHQLEPENAQVLYNRAEALLFVKRIEEALIDLNKFIQLDDSFAEAYDTRGKAKLLTKQFDQAILDFTKAIRLKPELESAWFNRALAYLFLSEFDKALNNLSQAININPQFAAAYNNRAELMLSLKRYDEALDDLNKAIEFEPRLSNAYKNRAKAFYGLKQFQLAISDLSRSLNFDPNDGDAFKLRGICYLELQKASLAHADFLKALELGVEIDTILIEQSKSKQRNLQEK